ncbi:MAG: hypothetical protein NTV02_02780 [Candidatus Zambryskibacteria bacterium]|nr:hypothetical protein [Candidatus Zambryskibacteria bacterium]
MAQLTRGVFGGLDDVQVDTDEVRDIFGFSSGHTSTKAIMFGCHWYNKTGEWLGFGDLDYGDFRCIMEVIEEGEMFVILSKTDLPRIQEQRGDVTPQYLAENARTVVVKGNLYEIDHNQLYVGEEVTTMVSGLIAKVVTPEAFSQMLSVTTAVTAPST